MGLVGFDAIEESDAIELHGLIEEHARAHRLAGRARASWRDWAEFLPRFKKVMPHDYKRALRELAEAEEPMHDGSTRGDRGRRRRRPRARGGNS